MSNTEDFRPQVIVIGAACVDIKGQALQPLEPGTSNPGEIRISVGGVGRNIAESLGRLDVPVSLISAVGDDDWGRSILRRTKRGGVDVRRVLICEGQRSAAFITVMDEKGERLASLDSVDLMSCITGRYLFERRSLFKEASTVIIDGNISEPALKVLLKLCQQYNLPIVLDPTTAVLARRLRPYLHHFYMVTPDAAEAEALSGLTIQSELDALRAAQAIVAAGVEIAIVTLAERGCLYATSETSGRVPAIRTEVVDRTGGGDALTAAVVFGIINDFPIDEAIRLGVAAAALTIGCKESVCPALSLEALYDAMTL